MKRNTKICATLAVGVAGLFSAYVAIPDSVHAADTPTHAAHMRDSTIPVYEQPANVPKGTLYFPYEGLRLEPLATGAPAKSAVTSADQALALIKSNGGLPEPGYPVSERPDVSFGSFTNTRAGTPQADGTLKLADANEAAWVFTWPLQTAQPSPVGQLKSTKPLPGNTRTHVYNPGDCVWFVVVTVDGTSPLQGQTCTQDSAKPPVATIN